MMSYQTPLNKNERLHPLIYTSLYFTAAQDIAVFQRFLGLGNNPPQKGHIFSDGLTIAVSLHLGHLTGWTFTCLILSYSKLVIGLLRVRKFSLRWSETGKQWVSSVAVPTKDIVIAHRPRDMLVCAWTLFGGVWRENSLVSWHCYT